MKIMVTAFEPFNESDFNSSYNVLNKIDNDVIKITLPVSYEKTPIKLIENINNINPDILIMLGEYGKGELLRLEKVAINYQGATIPDNDGISYTGERIDEGPDAIFTNVEIEKLNEHLISKGLKSYISLSAGSYICNKTFYTGRTYSANYKAIFIHIPKCESGSDIENDMIAALSEAVEFISHN